MRSFECQLSGRIIFGPGISENAGDIIKTLGGSRVLVVTDRGVIAAGLLADITRSIEKVDLSFSVFDRVEPNAPVRIVEDGARIQKDERCDFLLSVGGGSAIDTAKGIGILATNPGPLISYEGPDKFSNPPLPSVAIPTTAGTGSEVSFGVVMLDEKKKYKFSVRSHRQLPKAVLLDPLLLRGLPPQIIGVSGMDALAHALEAFVSLQSTHLTDAFCQENFRLVGKYLRRFMANPSDVEAAGGMLQASTMGALAFNTARVGLIHGMAHPLGAHYGIPHGGACAVLMPHVIEFNLMACPARYIEFVSSLEGRVEGGWEMERAHSAVEAVRRLSHDLGIQIDLAGSGMKEEHLKRLADETLSSGMHLTNPRMASKEDVIGIFRKALNEEKSGRP